MHRVIRTTILTLAASTLLAGGARAQSAGQDVMAQAPRFLLMQATSSGPVPVDPQREPVLLRRISLNLPDASLGEALGAISSRSGLRLMYSTTVAPVHRKVRLQAEDVTVGAALTHVLLGTGLDVMFTGRDEAVLVRHEDLSPPSKSARREPGVIVGRVVERDTWAPVVHAQVVVDGKGRAFTNADGRYEVHDVEPGPRTVVIASIGYAPDTSVVVVPDGGSITHNAVLDVVPTQLADLVVTATGEQRRVELGHDVAIVRADSIVQHAPVTSVTDLLEGRVPGMVVQRSSGAPGDPARIRTRGVSSPRLSNDPIIIVDGVRVYSDVSDWRGGNLATATYNAGTGDWTGSNYPAPSPLDYIDPNIIEDIQVIKGPSATTLYGQDAANGVIVITTKAGQPGETRWNLSLEQGETRIPGKYPELLLRWGHDPINGGRVFCPINNRVNGHSGLGPCVADSVVAFQVLNDPDLTILDRGRTTGVSLGVSGGLPGLFYNVSGSYRDEEGMMVLPRYEAERFRERHGFEPFDWMRRPQRLSRWNAQSRLTLKIGDKATVGLRTSLSRTEQQRSSLEKQLGVLMGAYLDRATGTYYVTAGPNGLLNARTFDQVLTDYYERVTATATQFTNGVQATWLPTSWFNVRADVGLNVVQRADEAFIPSGGFVTGAYSDGRLRAGQGLAITSTVNLHGSVQVPVGLGFTLRIGSGVNYTSKSVNDLITEATGLPEGTESLNGAAEIRSLRENRVSRATYGWYVEPGLNNGRLFVSTGLRLDGGSTFGARAKLPRFPKVSVSYLVSDEPFFPDALESVLSSLRFRFAYGESGRQPGPTDRLRLYSLAESEWVDGVYAPSVLLEEIGNSELLPERTREVEGGVDADLFDRRVWVNVTGYRQTTSDALLDVPVAPSVYGSNVNVLRNIGKVRNEGFEATLGIEPVRSDLVTITAQASLSRNRSLVVDLGPGMKPFATDGRGGDVEIRVVPGYPLFSRWARPVLGYADANGDGVLDASEVVLGDTLVYTGTTLPEYSANLNATASFFRGALTVSAGFVYMDGLTQHNAVGRRLAPLSRAWNDPSASLAEQVAVFDNSEFTWLQTVNLLRFNTLSATYRIPEEWASRVGAESMSVSLRGSNLGLWTNYRGMDPGVNASTVGNDVRDTGLLPQPRVWQVRVDARF